MYKKEIDCMFRPVYLVSLSFDSALSLAAYVFFFSTTSGCHDSSETRQIIVYTALDEEFSKPVLDLFHQQTGIKVLTKFDTESTKSVGLTQALFAERNRPRCDVFWNNEIVNTLRLDQVGLLHKYSSVVAEKYPKQYRSSRQTWFGFAARARVLIVNIDIVSNELSPSSIMDLVDAKWKERVAIAKPLAGTTATHAACLFTVWGEEKAKEYFRKIKENVNILSGNKQVAQAVARGEFAFGLTDTDDAMIELESGRAVKIVYPDQRLGELGTLFIPNTVSIIENAPHTKMAQQFIDFLLSADVEQMLARGPSAQIPLNPMVSVPLRVETPHTINAMEVDFEDAAKNWNSVADYLKEEFAKAN